MPTTPIIAICQQAILNERYTGMILTSSNATIHVARNEVLDALHQFEMRITVSRKDWIELENRSRILIYSALRGAELFRGYSFDGLVYHDITNPINEELKQAIYCAMVQ